MLPRCHQDIAAEFFALRKTHTGTRWTFSEGRNTSNPASHCDIAWAATLAAHAHTERRCTAGAAVLTDDGTIHNTDDPLPLEPDITPEQYQQWLLPSNDPSLRKPLAF
jgi:hypothetical protein